jgi:hypothetical protein
MRKVSKVAKQMVTRNRDHCRGGCEGEVDETIVVEVSRTMEIWRRHYENLMNEEFDWVRSSYVIAVSGPSEWISTSKVGAAMAKSGKAAGPYGGWTIWTIWSIVAEMLKESGRLASSG